MPVLSNSRHEPNGWFLSYDANTGEFRWTVTFHRMVEGEIAGSAHIQGYWQINVLRKRYLAHRLAWYFAYGEWPSAKIDHINGDKRDNRLSNLRLATPAQNAWNGTRRSTNTSGYKGVSFIPAEKCWRATLTKYGKQIHLGRFDDPKAAHAAYVRAAVKHFGEFASAV